MCWSQVLDSLKLVIPLLAAIVVWFLNERSKRAWDEYVRKEDNYRRLVVSLKGFYASTQDKDLKNAFLEQVSLSWLYSPDEVIREAYDFLSTVTTASSHADAEKERAVGELMLAVRRDLFSRRVTRSTELSAGDFRHLTAT